MHSSRDKLILELFEAFIGPAGMLPDTWPGLNRVFGSLR